MSLAPIALEQVIAWKPCCRNPGERYDDAHLAALFAGRAALTWPEVAALDIPREDVVWLITRNGALPLEIQVTLANRWADRAVQAHALHCGIAAVETWAQRWINGEDKSVKAARAATAAAAGWAAEAAALAALAAEAAWETRAAARAAARERQVADLLAVIQ